MKEKTSLNQNALNVFNNSNKDFINYEMQQLLFFKNDMLKDMKKLEDKFTFKIAEQNSINSEQFDKIKKQLNILSQQISQTNSRISKDIDFSEKIKDFQRFKLKTEDDINRLNSKIIITQKDQRDFINKFEKIVDDNLKYPGIIGNNAKFLNFRNFIDYSLSYFNEFIKFREYIKNFGLDDFKRKINSDIQEFRFMSVALILQIENGGQLAEILSNLAGIVRKRLELQLKVRAMSSESRMSAIVLCALPFVFAGIMAVINPGHLEELIKPGMGQTLLKIGCGLYFLGVVSMFKITKMKV